MNRMLLCSVVLTVGCGSSPSGNAPPGVPSEYSFLYSGSIATSDVAATWAGLPYDSIELERQGCFGTCPVYKVTLRKDGSSTYEGGAFVDRQGTWLGEVDIWAYGRLCYLIDELRFRELSSSYAASWTDAETVKLTVVRSGTTTPVTVSEYGGIGPPRLWALQLAVDATAESVKWAKAQ